MNEESSESMKVVENIKWRKDFSFLFFSYVCEEMWIENDFSSSSSLSFIWNISLFEYYILVT